MTVRVVIVNVMDLLFYCVLCMTVEVLRGIKADRDCGFYGKLEPLKMWWDIRKSGFHRELFTEVHCGANLPYDVRALLVQYLPSGVYIDHYQLSWQQPEPGLQVLLDSEVDIEAPAYISPELTAFLFLSRDPEGNCHFLATLPIHARYQHPSDSGQQWEQLNIEAPRLLLRADSCEKPFTIPPHKLVQAPCTVDNTSMCTWLEIHLQDKRAINLEIPVGNQVLIVPVCAGTLLVTLLCCGLIANAVLKHGFSQP